MAPSLFRRIHHVAVICHELERSRRFCVDVLGLAVAAENFQWHRGSTKVDLALPDGSRIELFHFTDAPPRPTRPEACGLRHLQAHGVEHGPTRVDEYTGRRFCFFADPDGLPIEAYESP
jgi:glyoxylase I family protein